MSAYDDWKIASFSLEQGMGRVRCETSGEEVAFAIEAWVPCDPVTARRMQDSDARRAELLPRPGEPVTVEWRLSRSGASVPARVTRAQSLALTPQSPFLDWLHAMGRHVADLRDWTDDEWSALFQALDDDIEDTIRSEEPAGPEQHLAILDWLRRNAPEDFVARRLAWLEIDDGADIVAFEAADGRVFVALPATIVAALVATKLVALAPA